MPDPSQLPPDNPLRRAFYLTGPTAVGKSALALELARQLDAEIIAVDSMTLYRGMDIGTAKTTPADQTLVRHHLLDVLDPWQCASVADYVQWATAAAADILARRKQPLFVGGTPLYLKALFRGLFPGPPADAHLRQVLEAQAEAEGTPILHTRLAKADPAAASRIHPNDRRRLIRALEVLTLTGLPISVQQTQHAEPTPDIKAVALLRDRPDLHARIDARVDHMIARGWLDEVRRLVRSPRGLHSTPAQAVGYQELRHVLATTLPLETAITRIKQRTRQFAKRQETWFRSLTEVTPHRLYTSTPTQHTLSDIAGLFLGDPTTPIDTSEAPD
jgi:tRNA dimethylallyltransferase